MDLITMLPSFYENDIVENIQNAFTVETDNIDNSVEDTLNQMFIETATFGLDKWENMLGISKNNFDYQTRRENLKAKIRGRGTTTIDSLKNICEAYSNGIVDIIINHSDYSFVIDFIGTVGIPVAFAELDKVINDIKPCHLAHSYKINYNTNSDLSKYTHEYLSGYSHDDLRNSEEFRGRGLHE